MVKQGEVETGLWFTKAMAFTYAMTGESPTQLHKDLLEKIENVIYTQPRHEHDGMALEIMMTALPDASGKEYSQQVVEALLKGFYEAQGYKKIS